MKINPFQPICSSPQTTSTVTATSTVNTSGLCYSGISLTTICAKKKKKRSLEDLAIVSGPIGQDESQMEIRPSQVAKQPEPSAIDVGRSRHNKAMDLNQVLVAF